jgi:hypothetical protein
MRRLIQLAESGNGDSGDYRKIDRWANAIAGVLVVIVVFLVYLMTARPQLWA